MQFSLLCTLPLYRGSLLSETSQYAAAMPNALLVTHEVEIGTPVKGLMVPVSEAGSPLQFAFVKVMTRNVIIPPPSLLLECSTSLPTASSKPGPSACSLVSCCIGEGEGSARTSRDSVSSLSLVGDGEA